MIKVSEDYIAPFGKIPALRLSIVPRWGIISMSRPQSVAEHVYNVMVICEWLCNAFNIRTHYIGNMVIEALHHDDCEIYSGDVPSPAKIGEPYDGCSPVVKLADCIEAYRYAHKYCNDSESVKDWLMKGLKESIIKHVDMIPHIEYIDILPIMEGH